MCKFFECNAVLFWFFFKKMKTMCYYVFFVPSTSKLVSQKVVSDIGNLGTLDPYSKINVNPDLIEKSVLVLL
jgi:hypothetical protein